MANPSRNSVINSEAKTTTYTIVDETLIYADATSAAFTITLPPAADQVDIPIHIIKTDSSVNAVTIDGDGSETINGATTLVISTQYDAPMLISDGTEWFNI